MKTQEQEPILTICIPTYNRKDVVVKDVLDYLSIKDKRFNIQVVDNCSTDGTYDALSQIHDNRLTVYKNDVNIGGTNNIMSSLQRIHTLYEILILDKDAINVSNLRAFLDMLEDLKPDWGYVNFHCNAIESPILYSCGIDAIRNSSAYCPKHPSGFFVKSELYNKALASGILNGIDNFFFPLELCQLYLAKHYDCTYVNIPLIIDGNLRGANNYGSYTYNENKCWFSPSRCLQYYTIFANKTCEMLQDVNDEKLILEEMTVGAINNVSIRYRMWMNSVEICSHYHLSPRTVTLFEMLWNVNLIMRSYWSIAKFNNLVDVKFYFYRWGKSIKSCSKMVIKDMIRGKQHALIRI